MSKDAGAVAARPRPRRRRAGRLLSAASAALLASGFLMACGGSSPATGATVRAFLQRGNGICRTAIRSASRLSQPRTPAERITFTEGADKIVTKAVAELHGVEPPAEQRAAYRTFVETIRREELGIGQLAEALRRRDIDLEKQALKTLSGTAANREASSLGLFECSHPIGSGPSG
jgi:hypothetical protein